MPKQDTFSAGSPCWVDLFSSDTDKSRAFYSELLGWRFEDSGPEFGGYINIFSGDAGVAGCMKNDGSTGMPDVWSLYLAVDDVKATVAAAEQHGGQVIVPAMDIMDVGSMAVVADAGGAAIGLWQPGTHKGFGVLAEPGAPGWFELYTRDYDKTVDFYQRVFGWETHAMSDSPEFRYTTLGEGESQAAGIMDAANFLPEGVPAHWCVYFVVDDTDVAVAKAVELGGTVLAPAEDTPYGRIAQLTDVTGAMFRLVSNG